MNFVGIIFSGILCENSVLLRVNIVCKMCLYSCAASVACSVSCSLSACTTVCVTITVRCLKCWHWLFNIIIVAVSLCYRIHILARERQRISDNACQRQQGTNDIWSVYNTSVSSIFYSLLFFYTSFILSVSMHSPVWLRVTKFVMKTHHGRTVRQWLRWIPKVTEAIICSQAAAAMTNLFLFLWQMML